MLETQNIENHDIFFENVALLIEQARKNAARSVDIVMCVTYFEIGRMIVEREQQGKLRAEYGKGLIVELSKYLTNRFGKGFSETNLRNTRKFYTTYLPEIQQTMNVESKTIKQQKVSAESVSIIQQKPSTEFHTQKSQSLISQFYPFKMYVNYYDRFVKKEFEKPTIGILLCKEKKDTLVQLTLPENANIFASEYTLYLPEKALLQEKLQQWTEEFESNQSSKIIKT